MPDEGESGTNDNLVNNSLPLTPPPENNVSSLLPPKNTNNSLGVGDVSMSETGTKTTGGDSSSPVQEQKANNGFVNSVNLDNNNNLFEPQNPVTQTSDNAVNDSDTKSVDENSPDSEEPKTGFINTININDILNS